MDLPAFGSDPIIVGTLVGVLALIMFAAAWHKFADIEEFSGALAAYRLLPEAFVALAARLLPVLETAIGAGILLPATRAMALATLAGLMALYALAIAVNLARGRRNIDCGCGGTAHPLSWALVVRNAVLAATAMVARSPTLERSMDWVDALTLVLGVLSFYALYLMADELMRQASRFARLHHNEPNQ
jgi:hypothetical protein